MRQYLQGRVILSLNRSVSRASPLLEQEQPGSETGATFRDEYSLPEVCSYILAP
jgi:hypothetical protein